jgi:polyhydroxyalkanoate synthesis regulator protein
MGGYLEKGAKAVIDMQEELRNQALKLFSGFPYTPGTPPAPGEEAKPKAKAAPKAGAKKGRKAK